MVARPVPGPEPGEERTIYASIFDRVIARDNGRATPRVAGAGSYFSGNRAIVSDRASRGAAYAYAVGRAVPAVGIVDPLPDVDVYDDITGELRFTRATRGDYRAARGDVPVYAFPAGDPTRDIVAPAPTEIRIFDPATVRARRARRARGVPQRYFRIRNKRRIAARDVAPRPAGYPKNATTGAPRGFARFVRSYATA